ncbi:putative coat protein [Fragaria chiloensis cryptic virus]|uniref:putative coat protein n=1 Tax=Fragaria chiloensis cryptic virus TaxID=335204 RepID=UPI0001509023|nr:putative coat protein [Fragaria chiloensis cryptic virus]ABC73696.1 putative coat protein [Fragaria chiloensis cryptic virus]
MATDNSDAKTEQSKVTESKGSSPTKSLPAHAADEKAAVGATFKLQSRQPTEPPAIPSVFAQSQSLNDSVGNPDFIAQLRDEGMYGLFLPRDRARRTPTPVTLRPLTYFQSIERTISQSMFHLLQTKTEFNNDDAIQRINTIAEQLAIGACLATHMKLRALIHLDFPDRYNIGSLKRPKTITDLPVVAPFAFAIQQLGYVNIANLTEERRYVPVLPETGHTFGIPTGHNWNPNLYAQAVDYARKFGLHFNVVDYTKKQGTAWWLLRQHFEDGIFELQLPLPEVNFTSSMALTLSLFLNAEEVNATSEIFDLTPVGADIYGYIMREPHLGINVSTFEVIDESAKEIVSNV